MGIELEPSASHIFNSTRSIQMAHLHEQLNSPPALGKAVPPPNPFLFPTPGSTIRAPDLCVVGAEGEDQLLLQD